MRVGVWTALPITPAIAARVTTGGTLGGESAHARLVMGTEVTAGGVLALRASATWVDVGESQLGLGWGLGILLGVASVEFGQRATADGLGETRGFDFALRM